MNGRRRSNNITQIHQSAVVPTDQTVVINGLNMDYPNCFAAPQFFEDAEGTIPASPTAGFLTCNAKTFNLGLFEDFDDNIITAVDPKTVHFTGNFTDFRMVPTGITGAAYYKIVLTCNENAPVNSQPENHLDVQNSSETPLLAGQTFTGPWTDVGIHSDVMIAVRTDKAGTYSIQFSTNAIDIDSTLIRQYRINQINVPHRFTVTRQYYRIVFTNITAEDQTFFRLQTHYGTYTNLNAPIDGIISPDFDSIAVRPTDYRDEVAMGLRQGKQLWHKWGYNNTLQNGVSQMIWSGGGDMSFLTVGSTLSFVSTSANDTDGGTGAHGIVVYGIDQNREEQTEVILLNGLTPVITNLLWLGINRIALSFSGSTQVNEGIITATATSDSSLQAHIPAGQGTSQQAMFFTQAGHTGLATGLLMNALKLTGGSAPKIQLLGWVLSFDTNSKVEVLRYGIDTAVENHLDYPPEDRFPVLQNSVLYFTAVSDTNNSNVGLRFSLIESRLFDDL